MVRAAAHAMLAVLAAVWVGAAGAAAVSVRAVAAVPAASAADPLPISPGQGLPGVTVKVTPTFEFTSDCTVEWDRKPVGVFACGASDGNYPSTSVTASGAPGEHDVRVCAPSCDSVDPVPEQATTFLVLTQVPDLRQLRLADVNNLVTDAQLTLGPITGPSGDPSAVVVDQTPEPGAAVPPETTVAVTFEVLPAAVQVPDVRGLRVGTAQSLLASRGLVLTVTSGSGSGKVVGQDPAPQTTVDPGSEVSVTLASPPATLVAVPDVRRLGVGRARAVLEAAGLTPAPHGASDGTVTDQRPRPGRLVRRGSSVSLTVAAPLAPADSVLGLSPTAFAVTGSAVAIVVIVAVSWLLLLRRAARRRALIPQPRPTVRLRPGVSHTDLEPDVSPPGPHIELRCRTRTDVELEESRS